MGKQRRRWDGLRGWLGRETWSLLTSLAVIGALVGTAVVVRARAGQKDNLRQAQIALAVVPQKLSAVVSTPLALLAGEPAGPTELPLNKGLRDELARTVVDLNHLWSAPVARALRARVALINARTAQMMGLIAQHRLRSANAIHDAYVQPLTHTLNSEIAAANSQLTRETRAADQATSTATLASVGVSGVLLLLLLIGLVVSRRRQQRTRIEEQRALRASEQRLQTLVEHGPDMITVVIPDTTVIYQAGAVESMLGYQPHELEGAKLTEWVDPGDRALLLALCATNGTASEELRLRHRDGSERTCEVHATSLLDDPAWRGIVLNIWDLSERRALEELLRHQVFHDSLTGLPNRTLALDRAEQMLARAQRQSLPVAALYVDVDYFKRVNDGFGHAAGDELLRLIASRLASVVRGGDSAARLAGDEFVVLVEGAAIDGGAELVAERLLEVLRVPYDMTAEIGRHLPVTASIGIALRSGGTAEQLLRDADVALYEAKRAGRNRYVLFQSGMETPALDRLTVEMDLAEALGRDELFLLYQPIFDLHSESVVGVEALIRWRHPTRGVVAPVEFIAIAEASELIVAIGRWVLDEACRQAAAWRAAGHRLGVSVNVSARQLDRDDLIDDVRHALEAARLDPALLTLEITETALMRDADATARRLASLKKFGVRIAIDDFGTGYSSLAYLSQFPVDSLKIDRSFIDGIASSSSATALIHTLVQLGKTLNIETVAEGIEESDQLHILQGELCDHGQGFLFARPLSPSAVEELLNGAAQTAAPTLTSA